MNNISKKEQVDNYLENFDWKRHWAEGWRAQMHRLSQTIPLLLGSQKRYAEGGYVTEPTNALLVKAEILNM